jgi:hypothetical protein
VQHNTVTLKQSSRVKPTDRETSPVLFISRSVKVYYL